jgi:hypothetical protein
LVRKYEDMTARIDPFITHCLAMMFGIAAYFTAPIEDAPCSESVCFYPLMDGRQFAYVRAGRGLGEACGKADLVLAPFIEARYPCRAFLVDRRHLTKGRAVRVMQAQSAYEIVEPARAGRRIWQAYYRPQPDDG